MTTADDISIFARRLGAIGTEARLRILGLLVSAGAQGLVVGEIARELGIRGSTLSHHLEKLRQQGLVKVRREGTFLWYSADSAMLRQLLEFLAAHCGAAGDAGGTIVTAPGPQGDLHP